jgi:hypothetical protein
MHTVERQYQNNKRSAPIPSGIKTDLSSDISGSAFHAKQTVSTEIISRVSRSVTSDAYPVVFDL